MSVSLAAAVPLDVLPEVELRVELHAATELTMRPSPTTPAATFLHESDILVRSLSLHARSAAPPRGVGAPGPLVRHLR
ncbi:hypothetical protein [Cellulomonas citrea]|uniref:hypothetical protein n=1 Tax=Cellulomonas citrea TaxID=1909423 RepID=UPI001F3493F4|nr:hypothetical protein [Cellulomonas citrea]